MNLAVCGTLSTQRWRGLVNRAANALTCKLLDTSKRDDTLVDSARVWLPIVRFDRLTCPGGYTRA